MVIQAGTVVPTFIALAYGWYSAILMPCGLFCSIKEIETIKEVDVFLSNDHSTKEEDAKLLLRTAASLGHPAVLRRNLTVSVLQTDVFVSRQQEHTFLKTLSQPQTAEQTGLNKVFFLMNCKLGINLPVDL